MNKPKVAILLHGLGANGIDTLFAELSQNWSDKLDVYYFLAVDEQAHQFWEDKVRNSSAHVVKLHDLDKNRLLQWPRSLYKALKQYGPFHAVHSNMDMLNGVNMAVARCMNIPVRISHAHRGSTTISGNYFRELISKTYRQFMRLLMNNLSTEKLACSDVAGKYFFGKNYRLIYNGINLDKYCSHDSVDENRPNGTIRFITVGRMHAPKNPLKIVSVFNEVHKRFPQTSLVWCGDGNLREAVENKIEEYNLMGAVNLIGTTDNVAKYLKRSDYFLLPSLYEGFSLALVEAQVSGLDCFVSDTCTRLSNFGKCIFIPLDASDAEWADVICRHLNEAKMQLDNDRLSIIDIRNMAKTLEEYYLYQ